MAKRLKRGALRVQKMAEKLAFSYGSVGRNPNPIHTVWHRKASGACSLQDRAGIDPFVNFGVTVGEGESTRLIVVRTGPIDPFRVLHSHGHARIVETAVILVENDPHGGRPCDVKIAQFTENGPLTGAGIAVVIVEPWSVDGQLAV